MSACPALMLCLGRRPSDSSDEGATQAHHTQRLRLLHEGDAHVCLLSHPRSVVTKILSSKVLRRWEPHRLRLGHDALVSLTPSGFMESPLAYSNVEEVHAVDSVQRYCVSVVLTDGSLLIQAGNAYIRDQWLHSILWKKNLSKYRNLLSHHVKPEAVLKEIKGLVELSQSCPLQDESVMREPLELAATLMLKAGEDDGALLDAVSPLLEAAPVPPPTLCLRMGAICQRRPLPPAVADHVAPVVHRILRRTVDFSRAPPTRLLAERFLLALEPDPRGFVATLHGATSACPHPRVLPNLVAVALAMVSAGDDAIPCCLTVLQAASEYDDWLPGLSQLLQPIPFPEEVVANEEFLRGLTVVLRRIGTDLRCDVHSAVLGVRDGKDGWFHLLCTEHGELWGLVLKTLLNCCCRRKQFLQRLTAQLGPCLLQALRDCAAALEALCLMLEWNLIESEDQRAQIVATLQSTADGRQHYFNLCLRQQHLHELQQKGGPRKLTLPSRSTDADMAKLLSCGSFGNLECLSLAFTHVTSACAEQLIKLPSLRYLNLWATQFGDTGLLMICEHLQRLQVLNLCETQVSDKGIAALSSMTSLRKLNLNSTKLSAHTFEKLKQQLPALQEFDVRYTEAW